MQPNAPNQPGQVPPPQQPGHPQEYEFIMNPAAGKPPRVALAPSGMLPRIALVLGGLLVLMIIFVIFKSILGGSGNKNGTALIAVAQQQQAIIHVVTNASQQFNVTTQTKNSVSTIQLSLTSDKSNLLAYLKSNHIKLSTTQLNLKVSTATDAQLTAAVASGTYDQTYRSVMQTLLGTYEQLLKTAYNQTSGPKGKALLSAEYDSADLLIKQLGN